jgi:hypothetical protein
LCRNVGDPSRSSTTFKVNGLDWQTDISAAVDTKGVSAELANRASYQPKSPNFASSPIFHNATADPRLVAGYLSGEVATAPTRKGPSPALERQYLTRFASRQRQRSPDRKASRDRRRMLGGSSALPDNLRHHYTEGQRSVLCVIAGEIKHHRVCDLSIEAIAARAGVCRTTVQTTQHEARRLGHITIIERPRRGCKSLTNIVRISSPEWLTWLRRGPSAARLIRTSP